MALFRRSTLVDVPADIDRIPVPGITVHTAETMVVLTVASTASTLLIDAAASRRPVALTGENVVVNLVPVKDRRLVPAFDPDLGWIIPLTSAVAEDLARQVAGGPGGYEIEGLNLGVVVADGDSAA
ncbi:hypothetical protein CATRI_03910 [Corynebacterium atrinae]|uniref:hypothetical protein n=1 Tax=Corynebacterium atrinae TaxID=1336740 RepID=UPI0025B600B5|nr:hypothetical protein [Corynebacterium atrinae]WJY62880.1 hypothetical protein CATRI_03910 [Corynebacterium atrinae]